MGQYVLDVRLLEEPQTAANRIGNPARQQLSLQQDAIVVIAIQDGHLPELDPALAAFENLLADQRRLFVGIAGRDDQRKQAVGPRRLEFLGEIPPCCRPIDAWVRATI